ncbi:multisubunit Na+/H+ antiporter MnhF subunit [Sphingomonas sp. PvP056]
MTTFVLTALLLVAMAMTGLAFRSLARPWLPRRIAGRSSIKTARCMCAPEM